MLDSLLDNNLIASLLAFGLILIPAVIIHELGHFFAAKWVGINVLEFGVGFPPRMMRLFTWGETEFTLNWLPLGGFVRPLGEDMIGPVIPVEEEDDDEFSDGKHKNIVYITEREELMARGVPEEKLMSVNEAKPLPRIFFMAAGAMFNVGSAMIFFVIAALLGLPQTVGARITLLEIPTNSVFDLQEVAAGDAVERVNGEYFQTPTAFFELWQANADEPLTLDMQDGESGERYEVTITPEPIQVYGEVVVTVVIDDTPAAEANIQEGDIILLVNGETLPYEDPLGKLVELVQTDESVTFTIKRGADMLDVVLTPRDSEGDVRVGIGMARAYSTSDGVRWAAANDQQELVPRSLPDSVQYSLTRTYNIIESVVTLPIELIRGRITPEQARPVSIVGISQLGGQFIQESARTGNIAIVLDFLALLSIFLGITNLLPFPPLDGGRILFVLIEMVRGKPVSPEVENLVYRIGIGLLLALGVVIILYDIFNPIV